MAKHKKCDICNSTNLFKLNGYYKKHGLVKCGNCSFVFIENVPTEKDLSDYYENNSRTTNN